MKVIHGYFSMQIGGVEQNLLRTMPRYLKDEDADHELVLTHPEGSLLDRLPGELTVHTPSHDRLFSNLYELYGDADVVHLYTINENPIHRLPAHLANTPIVDNPRNLISIPHSNRVQRVGCASKAIAERQNCPRKVTVIPNGIEVDPEDPPNYDKYSEDVPLRLIEIGRKDKERTHRAEDFMPLLKQSFPDMECYVLGRDGEDHDGIKYQGYVEDPTEYYEKAHFLTHFVETEPFGMTPLEGYRAGTIPIASGDGGIRELIKHSETGYYLDSPNKGDVIKQLKIIAQQYYENPEFWVPMARNGFQWLAERFSVDEHVRRYQELYRDVHGDDQPRRFPDHEWSLDFDEWFRSMTLRDHEVQPDSLRHGEMPEPLERDLARLMEADELYEEEPERVLEILDEVESESFTTHYEVWILRAHAHQMLDHIDRALETAREAMELEPDLPEPYFIVAQGKLSQRNVEGALDVLRSYRDRNPDYQPVKDMMKEIAPLRQT